MAESKPTPRDGPHELASTLNEIRMLLRILVLIGVAILLVVLVAGIVTVSTASHVQQQLGIN